MYLNVCEFQYPCTAAMSILCKNMCECLQILYMHALFMPMHVHSPVPP